MKIVCIKVILSIHRSLQIIIYKLKKILFQLKITKQQNRRIKYFHFKQNCDIIRAKSNKKCNLFSFDALQIFVVDDMVYVHFQLIFKLQYIYGVCIMKWKIVQNFNPKYEFSYLLISE